MTITIREFSDLAEADPLAFLNVIRTAEQAVADAEQTKRDNDLTAALISIEAILVKDFDPLLLVRDLRKSYPDQRKDVESNLRLIDLEIKKRLGDTEAEIQAYQIKLKERFKVQELLLKTIKDEQRTDKEV